MIQLQIIIIIFLVLFIISAIPIIQLKYYSDLYDYVDTMNKHCYNNNIERLERLPEKDTYIWNISNYLYDFSTIDNIKDRDENSMVVYQSYMKYSIPIFLLLWFFGIVYIVYSIIYNYIYLDYYNISLLIYFCIFIVIFTVIFSIILKKITEIYNDTKILLYLKTMHVINNILNNSENDYFKSIKNSSYDPKSIDNIYNVKNVVLEDTFLTNIQGKLTKEEITNYIETMIKMKHDLKYKNKDNIKDAIKDKINVVTSLILAYFIMMIPLLLMLLRTINNNYIYIYIILIVVICVIIYYIYNSLR